jgi:predicted transcriptional regulator
MSIELEKLAPRRKALGVTQAQLAELAGVPQGYISRIETNAFAKRGPGYERLSRVFDALDKAEAGAKQ